MKSLCAVSLCILIHIFCLSLNHYARATDDIFTEEGYSQWMISNINKTESIYKDYPHLMDYIQEEGCRHDLALDLALLDKILDTLMHRPCEILEHRITLDAFRKVAYNRICNHKDATILNPIAKRQRDRFLQIGELIFPHSVRRTHTEIINQGGAFILSSFEVFAKEIKNTNIDSLDTDAKIQQKWKTKSEQLGSQLKPVLDKYFNFLDSLVPYGYEIGIHNTWSMWEYINGYHQFSVNEIKRLWKELKEPYRQLMSYMRNDFQSLYKTYAGIEKEKGYMPAYIFDYILNSHTAMDSRRPVSIFNNQIVNRMNSLHNFNANYIKHFNAKSFTREANKFFEALGFPKLEKSFWDNSIFVNVVYTNTSEIKKMYIEINGKEKLIIQVKTNVNFDDYESIIETLYDVHKENIMLKRKCPRVLRDVDYVPFSRAFKETLLMGATSLKYISKIGLLKADLHHDEVMNWFKGAAIRDFTVISSIMALNTWKYDVMDKKIGIKKRISEYWRRRLEYEGVVPTTTHSPKDVNTSILFDVFNGNQIFMSDYNFGNLVTKILQYQIFARFCELAGQYDPNNPMTKPLYKCDYKNNLRVGDLIRTITGYGGMKSWRELFDIIMGTQNTTLNVKGILGYFAPIFDDIDLQKYTL